MKFNHIILLLCCMPFSRCSASLEKEAKRQKVETINNVAILQGHEHSFALPEPQYATSAAPGQANVHVEPVRNIVSLVVDCMATRYRGIGNCTENDQNMYTTLEMQALALKTSLQYGISSGEYDSMASVLGAIQISPNGHSVAVQFYQDEIARAIVAKSGETLAGLLLAGPDVMMRNAGMFQGTLVYASCNDVQLIHMCLDAIGKNLNDFETVINEALWAASEFHPECLDVLLRRLWDKLPELSWKLDDELLHYMSKSVECVSTILELTDGRIELYTSELSALLLGASSGHAKSLTMIIAAIESIPNLFKNAIGHAVVNTSRRHTQCLDLILPLVKGKTKLFKQSIQRALLRASKGHHECLRLILGVVQDDLKIFTNSVGLALENASKGHLRCLELIIPIVKSNVETFKWNIGWALIDASNGHPGCLELIVPLIHDVELFTGDIGLAVIMARNGHSECLKVLVPIMRDNVAVFKKPIAFALENASNGHPKCLDLIMPLIKENVHLFRDDIIKALEVARELGNTSWIATLESMC